MDTRDQTGGDDRLITQYLLGALPPAETDRLDELSVTDDDFAGRLEAVENDLVDAYARGELSESALEQFNSFYLASPKRCEKAKFAQAFRAAAQQAVSVPAPIDRKEIAPRTADRGTMAGPTKRRRALSLSQTWRRWAFAAAASLLVTVTGWLAVENRRMRRERDAALEARRAAEQRTQRLKTQLASSPASEQKPDPVIVALNLPPQMRGVSQMPELMIPAGTDYVALQLELESAQHNAWRAQVRELPGRQPVWTSGRLSARGRYDRWTVTVSFSPRLLQARPYVVELAGISPSGSEELIASYAFRVIRK